MNERKRIIRLSIFYFAIIVLVSLALPREINWSPSFSQNHSWPYGTKVLKAVISDLFPETQIINNSKPIYNEIRDREGRSTLFIVDDTFNPDTLEINSLLEYVVKGNSAFLSANNFGFNLLDTLKLDYDQIYKSETIISSGLLTCSYETNFFHEDGRRDSSYHFELENGAMHLYNLDSVETITALAWIDGDSLYSFIKKKVGDGFFYLHTNPYLFTNYHVLTDQGKSYAEHIFSHFPDQEIIWDEYYKEINQQYAASPINVVLKQPALRWAYWMIVISIFMVLLFLTKRKQRIIPVLESYKNDSVDFTKTIGQLYFNHADNRSLAIKKINILKEYLHRKYQMSNINFTKEDAQYILKRSDLEEIELMKLWETIWNIQDAEIVYNGRLKVLNKLVNKIMQKV